MAARHAKQSKNIQICLLYVQKASAKNDMRATMGMDLREPYAESSVFFDTILVGAGAEYVNL